MGALVGAYYALGGDINELEKIALSFNKTKLFKKIIDFSWSKKSLIKGVKVSGFIEELIADKKFSDVKIPLKIIATELRSGEEVVLDKGKISDAVRASISVPGIFPPIELKGKYLLDGGLVNPTPVDVLEKMGAQKLIAVDFYINNKQEFKNPGVFTVLMQSYEIMREHTVRMNLPKNKNLVIIKPKIRSTIDSFKFHDIKKIIDSGTEAAREVMLKIKKLN